MDKTTFFIYIAMYLYGFSMMIWAIFFDKHPTKRSIRASKIGIGALIVTLFYFFYVIIALGIH